MIRKEIVLDNSPKDEVFRILRNRGDLYLLSGNNRIFSISKLEMKPYSTTVISKDSGYINTGVFEEDLFHPINNPSELFTLDGREFKLFKKTRNGSQYLLSRNTFSLAGALSAKVCSGSLTYYYNDFATDKVLEVDASGKIFNNKILTFKEFRVSCYDAITLEQEWSKDFEDELPETYLRRKHFYPHIGVVDDVFISGYGSDYSIGIDLIKGEVKWLEKGTAFGTSISPDNNLMTMGPPMILRNPRSGLEIGRYAEVDERLRNQRNNFIFIGDHVIISGTPRDSIAAFNMNTHVLDWIHKESGTMFSGEPMKYYHPYLFVNDSKGNIHVYEVSDEMRDGQLT